VTLGESHIPDSGITQAVINHMYYSGRSCFIGVELAHTDSYAGNN
jgi:hypothetical protein